MLTSVVLVSAVLLAVVCAQPTPDLVVNFSAMLHGPKARPAIRAVAGLLNGGPEFGAKFLDPLRMGNYRGAECQSPSAYAAMTQAGATYIQCDMDQLAANCTALPPNLNDTSMCSVWPGRNGDWTLWEQKIVEVVASKAGPRTSWGVWNEPNDGFWPGCTSGCTVPDPQWLTVWNRTVRAIRVRIPKLNNVLERFTNSHTSSYYICEISAHSSMARQVADTDHPGKIVGPSINQFDFGYLTAFVDWTVAHGVVPDILDWHELQGDSITSTSEHHKKIRRWLRAHHPSLAGIPIGHGEMVPQSARLWAGATLGALADAERAGATFGVHSNWGESGRGWEPQGHYTQCGFEELVTCNDQPPAGPDSTRQPRATYHVYAAYGNTSGVMVPVSRHCDFADAFASYDGALGNGWIVVGSYHPSGPGNQTQTILLRLSGLPAALVSGLQTTVTLGKIPNSLQLALPQPLSMGTSLHSVMRSADNIGGFDLDLQLDIDNHDVWTVRVLKPQKTDDDATRGSYDSHGNLQMPFWDRSVAPATSDSRRLRIMTFYGGTPTELKSVNVNVLRAGVANCANQTIMKTWKMKLFVHLPAIFDKHRRQNTTGHPGLKPDWKNVTDQFIAEVKPHVGTCVLGVFIGDEICCGGVPYADLDVVSTRLKVGLREAIIYVNECTNVQSWPNIECNGGRCTGGVPAGLDAISVDLYDQHNTDGHKEVLSMKVMYHRHVYPRLHPHQRVLFVPGVFASDPVHCTARNTSCPLDEQADQVVLKLQGYLDWMKNDSRVIGFVRVHALFLSVPVGIAGWPLTGAMSAMNVCRTLGTSRIGLIQSHPTRTICGSAPSRCHAS
jgi:hypothetical protein